MFVKFTKVGSTRKVSFRPDDVALLEEETIVVNGSSVLAVKIYLKDGRVANVKDSMDEVLYVLNRRSPSQEHMEYAQNDINLLVAALSIDPDEVGMKDLVMAMNIKLDEAAEREQRGGKQ